MPTASSYPFFDHFVADFRGYGKNKISFFHECFLAEYRYAVLNDFYCVHLDHPPISKKVKSTQGKMSIQVWENYQRDYLGPKYGK